MVRNKIEDGGGAKKNISPPKGIDFAKKKKVTSSAQFSIF